MCISGSVLICISGFIQTGLAFVVSIELVSSFEQWICIIYTLNTVSALSSLSFRIISPR